MKNFIIKLTFTFILPLILLLCALEWALRAIPNDYAFIRSNNSAEALYFLRTEAAKVGARYVYITKFINTNNGYWWEQEEGEGFLIEAELYN